jgi:hypothetical protein
MLKKTFLIAMLVIGLITLYSTIASAWIPRWNWGSTVNQNKVMMQGEGECEAGQPYGDCGVEIVVLAPIFNQQTKEDDEDCKTFAPMDMVNEDPETWFEDDCVTPVLVIQDNPNKTRRNPKVDKKDPNEYKWTDLQTAETLGSETECDENGACWVISYFDFDDVFKKNWVGTGIAAKFLGINITYPRGFVCGDINGDGDIVPVGVPAPNNFDCCEEGFIDPDTGGCVEGYESFQKVACEDPTRITDGGVFSLDQPGCEPQIGSFQEWGDPQGSYPGYTDYRGLPDVFLQGLWLPDGFVYDPDPDETQWYPFEVCPSPGDDPSNSDGLTEEVWDCFPPTPWL